MINHYNLTYLMLFWNKNKINENKLKTLALEGYAVCYYKRIDSSWIL